MANKPQTCARCTTHIKLSSKLGTLFTHVEQPAAGAAPQKGTERPVTKSCFATCCTNSLIHTRTNTQTQAGRMSERLGRQSDVFIVTSHN